MSFIDYLNNYEKKLVDVKPVLTKKQPVVVKTAITENRQQSTTQPQQKVIIKKVIVKEKVYIDAATGRIIESKNFKLQQPILKKKLDNPLSHAAGILDEMVDGASIGSYYAPSAPEERVLPKKLSESIRNKAMNILGDDDSGPQPLNQMSDEMLRLVPREFLQKDGINVPPPQNINTNRQPINENAAIPDEIKKMMADNQTIQNRFSNVDTTEALKQAAALGL